MSFENREPVTVVDSPDAPGLIGKTGEAWPTGDGRVQVAGIRDTDLDELLGPPTFHPDQLRKA